VIYDQPIKVSTIGCHGVKWLKNQFENFFNPVGKIAKKAVWRRSVFLLIRHSKYSTIWIHSYRLLFRRFFPLGRGCVLDIQYVSNKRRFSGDGFLKGCFERGCIYSIH